MSQPLQIVQLLDNRRFAIRGGKDCGVKRGAQYGVLDAPMAIRDPDTQEHLGEIVQVKATVIVDEVHDRIAVCSGFRADIPPDWRRTQETIRVGDALLPLPKLVLDPHQEPSVFPLGGIFNPPRMTRDRGFFGRLLETKG